jgi:hypothetical protein
MQVSLDLLRLMRKEQWLHQGLIVRMMQALLLVVLYSFFPPIGYLLLC